MENDNKALVKKLASLGWQVNGDRLETSHTYNKEDAHHLSVELEPIAHRVGLQVDSFNHDRKISMDTKKAVRFFTEQQTDILLTDPTASLAPKTRRRG